MADPTAEAVPTSPPSPSLTENIFVSSLAVTLELALVYLFTTILILCGLYTELWSLEAVGLLAIIHLIAIPISYFGVRNDVRILVLLGLLLCCIWFILIVVYIVVFLINKFEKNDFKHRSLHHSVLVFYTLFDVILIVLLSMNIINESTGHSIHHQYQPTAASHPPSAPPPSSSKSAPPATVTTAGSKTAATHKKSVTKDQKQ